VALPGERENLALGEALEEQGRDLALQLSTRPTLARGLDLVERTRGLVSDLQEKPVVRPGQMRREERPARENVPQRGTFLRDGEGCRRFVPHRGG
jgi:hypothetical protein